MRYALLVACTLLSASAVADDAAKPVYPLEATVAKDGTLYLVDRKLPGVWKATPGGFAVHVRGDKRFRQPLNAPRCIAFDADGRLLVGDSATRDVYRIDDEGQAKPLTIVPPNGDDPGLPGAVGIPMGIAVDSTGSILVSDIEVHRIWRIPAEGGRPTEFATVRAPRGLAIDAEDRLWVVTHDDNQVVRLDKDGQREVIVKGRPFRFPNAIAVTPEGTAYVSDGYSKAVWRIEPGAEPKKVCEGDPLKNPVGLHWHDDRLIVVDPKAGVFEMTPAGELSPVRMPAASN